MEEKNILFEIKTLEQLIIREVLLKSLDKNLNIKKMPSPTQMRIIDYIIQNEDKPIYQKDLESIFNLRRATISEVLITMEKNGMIERVISKDDSRTKEIKLSDSTKEFFEENKHRILELESIITKDIDKKDIDVFKSVICKMKDNIQIMSSSKESNIRLKERE